MAYNLAFATDCRILYPAYFDAQWVAQRQRVAEGSGPKELNPLRARRFLPLVAGKTQAQLDELLRQEIRRKLHEGRMVALLTTSLTPAGEVDRKPQWLARLGPGFDLKELGKSELTWVVCQIVPKR